MTETIEWRTGVERDIERDAEEEQAVCTVNPSGCHSFHTWPYTHCSSCGKEAPSLDALLKRRADVARGRPEAPTHWRLGRQGR